jgi:hypothetical protein
VRLALSIFAPLRANPRLLSTVAQGLLDASFGSTLAISSAPAERAA